jgi:hypothetical protein
LFFHNNNRASIEQIEKFVVLGTLFREPHYKKNLIEIEKANPPEIEIVKCKSGMIIKFNPRFEQNSQAKDLSQTKGHSQTTLSN